VQNVKSPRIGAFIPHLIWFGEATREVAWHFAAEEMENFVGGTFVDKTLACPFFGG
jgi:hypothetical protein